MTEHTQGLLPCPFCGARPIIREGKKGYCQLHGEPNQGIKVFCPTSGCGAAAGVEAGDIYDNGVDKAKSEAVASWNRRAPALIDLLAVAESVVAWADHQVLLFGTHEASLVVDAARTAIAKAKGVTL